jgi:hypothetical protein
MSLAASGNRPEASYTTEERIIRDLDDSFVVDRRPEDGSWVINRLISRCPHCRGAGFVRDFLPVTAEFVEGYASVDAAGVIEVKTTKCDHPAA